MHDDREMKAIPIALIFGFAGITHAQTPAVVDSEAQSPEDVPLTEGEKRLQKGIVLLASIYQSMADVKDKATAEAAVPKIVKLCEDMQQWSQAFNNLPPLSEPEVLLYEDRYLPTIRKINKYIRTQADRLAAAEYYGSINLPAALVKLAQISR